MHVNTRIGRIVGALLLAQFAGGIVVNFVLGAPLTGEPGFLLNAGAHASQIGLMALLAVCLGLLGIAIAALVFPVIGAHSPTLALFQFALAIAAFVLLVAEHVGVMSMLSLSEAYMADTAQDTLYHPLAGAVAASRKWMHYLALLVSGCTLFVLYAAYARFRLVPRLLAGIGVLAVVLQLLAVAMPLFGHAIDLRMLAPLALCQIVLALWLIARGFRATDVAPV